MADRRNDRLWGMGELQLAVLDALSELGEATVYDLLEQFDGAGRPKYTTVATVLRSLEERGLAEHRTEGRTYIYRPVLKSAQVRRNLLGEVIDRAFGGSPKALVAALLDVDSVTPDVVAELEELIARRGDEPDG